jgi:LemA protein
MNTILLCIILSLPLILLFWVISINNRLIRLQLGVKNAWAQIDVQLKRRHDLIPNLVNSVQGYAAHERDTLEAVVVARAVAIRATETSDVIKAEGDLSAALGRLLAISEGYPTLKANENFLQLQHELSSTEDRIAMSRQGYNNAVTIFNTETRIFPSVIVAGMKGMKDEPLFEGTSEDRTVPEVKFT